MAMNKGQRRDRYPKGVFSETKWAESEEVDPCGFRSETEAPKGWVVLAGQGQNLSHDVCSYVRQLCRSTGSGLHIIWQGSFSLGELERTFQGVPYEVDIVSDDLERDLPRYLRRLRRVVMVVIASDKRRFRAFFSKLSAEFACPLVVISEKQGLP